MLTVLQQGGVGIGGVAVAGDALRPHHDRAGRAMAAEPGEELGARPSDHHLHEIVDLQFADVAAADPFAVAQDRDPVADLLHLVQAMGDVDDGEAARLQVGDDAEQALDFALGQRGGRLVHHDDPRISREGAGDLHHLLLADREVADRHHRVEVEVEVLQHLLASRRASATRRRTRPCRGSRPRNMFSATVMVGIRLNSW